MFKRRSYTNRCGPFFSLLLFLLLSSGFSLQAQDDFRGKFDEGTKLMAEKLYDRAVKVWKELAEENPDNANVNYMAGKAYLKSRKPGADALSYLEKAVKGISDKWRPRNFRLKSAPQKARYYYARSLHLNEKVEKAIEAYERFREEVGKKHFLYPDAGRQIELCKNAQDIMQDPMDLSVENLGDSVNSPYPDYSPVLSIDENILYFTSRRPPKKGDPTINDDGLPAEKIYVSYKDQGEWGTPKRLHFGRSESIGHLATIGVSVDGQRLFLFKGNKGNGDIYQSRVEGDGWSEVEPLGSNINTDAWETHAVLSADERVLYFVSDRDGGFGGRDLYRVKKLPNGKWSKALNLGPKVNTEYDEDAPFIHPDGKTLYFSSKGHKSIGGFDIFFTEKKEAGQGKVEWTEPTNVGYPVNTTGNDVFFVTSADGKRAYYSTVREDGLGDQDLYKVRLEDTVRTQDVAVLKGFVSVREDQEIPDELSVDITNMSTNQTTTHTPRQRDGVFVAALPPCKEYLLEYKMGMEAFKTDTVEIPCNSSYSEVNKSLFLNPISLDSSLVLDRIEDERESELKGKILLDGKPYERSDVVIKYLNKDGRVVNTQDVQAGGVFEYYELPGDQDFIVELSSDKPHLCERMEMVITNERGRVVRKTVRDEKCRFKYKEMEDLEKVESIYRGEHPDVSGQLNVNDDPYSGDEPIKMEFRDADSNVVFVRKVGEDGRFGYTELPSDQDFIVTLSTDDPDLCNKGSLELMTNNGRGLKKLERKDGTCVFKYATPPAKIEKKEVDAQEPVDRDEMEMGDKETIEHIKEGGSYSGAKDKYLQYFGFNAGEPNKGQAAFQKFLEDIATELEEKGEVTVRVEGSASRVPTRTFNSNEDLASYRADKGEQALLQSLKEEGVDTSGVKIVKETKVQGPLYQRGNIVTKEKYGKFQYVLYKILD